MSNRASILLLSKDRHYLISGCLQSLLQTTNRSDVEVLLGDTGSTDPNVFQCYEDFGRRFSGRFELVQLPSYHFSSNNNVLASMASGEILVLLNNDTLALDGWLEPLLDYAQRTDVGAVGAKLLYGDHTVQHAGVEYLRSGENQYSGYHPYRGRRRAMPEVCFDKYVPAVTGACLAVRRSLFESQGGLDEEFREEAQDSDFCLRLGKAGLKNVYAASAQLHHFENGTRSCSEHHADRMLHQRRWKRFLRESVFAPRFQSTPVDANHALQRSRCKYVLFERGQARGDVLASTCVIDAYKKANPDHHISYKSEYPELVDDLPFIDRAVQMHDTDDFSYDYRFKLTYENGEWKNQPHTWVREMARGIGIAPPLDLRPRYRFHIWDRKTRDFYSSMAAQRPYVVLATGAGWDEKEWSQPQWVRLAQWLTSNGFGAIQIGSSGDSWIDADVLHLFDRSLHDNLAILENAQAAVVLDSYAYHLATAVGVPTVILTCKTCLNTTESFANVVEVRNRWAETTPRTACRTLGCRIKSGRGGDNFCDAPILKTLPATAVQQALQPILERT